MSPDKKADSVADDWSEPAQKKEKPKVKKKGIVFTQGVIDRKTGKRKVVELTKADMDWRKDPVLKQFVNFAAQFDDDMRAIPQVKGVIQFVATMTPGLATHYERFKKAGRI